VDVEGNLYIADAANGRIRKVAPYRSSLDLVGEEDVVFPEPNGQGHVVSSRGPHLRTIDLNTGIVLQEFGYNSDTQLVSITDRFAGRTVIERDGRGSPTAIVSPDEIRTGLSVDANNHLVAISHPDGNQQSFIYTADGLLTTRTEPEGNRFSQQFDALGRLSTLTDEEGGYWRYTSQVLETVIPLPK